MTVSFVTTCKSRLHHLQQTLPLLVEQSPAEIIVVDYACPQTSGDWVEAHYPGVKVVRVQDDDGFNLSRARNIGAQHAREEWIFFIDADIRIASGLIDWLHEHLRPGAFYRASVVGAQRDLDTWGSVVCERRVFQRIGGYDEIYSGWGGEDDDLYARLTLAGVAEQYYPLEFLNAITHSDSDRVLHHKIKSRALQAVINKVYQHAKFQVGRNLGDVNQLAPSVRQQIMQGVVSEITKMYDNPLASEAEVSITVDGGNRSLVRGFNLNTRLRLSFRISREQPDSELLN